jgi:hypothetical protein
MSNKKTNEENFKRYQERLAELQRQGNLIPSPDLPPDQLIMHLAAEGEKMLAAETPFKGKVYPKKDDSKKLDTALGLTSKNPYIRARIMVLEKLPAWRKKELAEMEQTGNINNKYYEEFVREVASLGDTL